MKTGEQKLPIPVGCAWCRDRPYTWRSGLRHHVTQKHANLSPEAQRALVKTSLKNLRGWDAQ